MQECNFCKKNVSCLFTKIYNCVINFQTNFVILACGKFSILFGTVTCFDVSVDLKEYKFVIVDFLGGNGLLDWDKFRIQHILNQVACYP